MALLHNGRALAQVCRFLLLSFVRIGSTGRDKGRESGIYGTTTFCFPTVEYKRQLYHDFDFLLKPHGHYSNVRVIASYNPSKVVVSSPRRPPPSFSGTFLFLLLIVDC